jgi:hypothetical protein
MSSNSRIVSTVGRQQLGWKPTREPEEFKKGFVEEVEAAGVK